MTRTTRLARAMRGHCTAALATTCALIATPAAHAVTQPATSTALTDGRTFAHWAHPASRAYIRRQPSATSPRIARLHHRTEDGFPEVYAALRSYTDTNGHVWVRVRIPMRPNGRTGWVREFHLGPLYRVKTRLVVDRNAHRATLYRSGRRIWRSPVGVGASATPTPAGRFWIREKFRVDDSGGMYGPRAFGTSSYSRLTDWPGGGVIGIHGTNQPSLIPGRPSSGCIRVPNAAVRQLYKLMPVGTPVDIR